MKDGRLLAKRLTKRILYLAYVQVIAVTASVALWMAALHLWIAGLFLLPVAIWQGNEIRKAHNAWLKTASKSDLALLRAEGKDQPSQEIALPHWAFIWDDTMDIEVRGRPAAQFVWQYDVSWPVATFLWLQFYNPLANASALLKRKLGRR